MDEYIKREDVISAMCFGCNQQFSDEPCEPSECALRQAINAVPTADVVEVVRCKDCKYCEIYYPVKHLGIESVKNFYCNFSREVVGRFENDFCSYGERKE